MKNEHDNFVSQEEENDDQDLVEKGSKDYQKAYLNAMINFQNKYNLSSINVAVDPPKRAPEGQASASQLAKS